MTEKAKPATKTPALTLAAKLLAIRKEVLYLEKTAKSGGSGFTYKYVKGVDVIAAIKPKMDELGLLLIPQIVSSKVQVVLARRYDWDAKVEAPEKPQYLVEMDMFMVWVDVESGEKLEVPFFIMANMDDAAKSVGAGLTYAERYFLCKFFQVETDELDPDAYQRKKGDAAGSSGEDLEAATSAGRKEASGRTLASLLSVLDGLTAATAVNNWVKKYKGLFHNALHPDHQKELGAAIASKNGQIEAVKAAKSQPSPNYGPAPSGPDEEPPHPANDGAGPVDKPEADDFPF